MKLIIEIGHDFTFFTEESNDEHERAESNRMRNPGLNRSDFSHGDDPIGFGPEQYVVIDIPD